MPIHSKPISVMKRKVTVPGGETVKSMFDVNVAELLAGAALPADLGFKLVFKADETAGVKYSDGMFVNVPVYAAVQTLAESHSAVLRAGMDKDSLTAQLRGMFVNVAVDDADHKRTGSMFPRHCAPPRKKQTLQVYICRHNTGTTALLH